MSQSSTVDDRKPTAARGRVSRSSGSPASGVLRPLLAVSGAITVIGVIDAALVWVPPQFGDPQWEFGVLTRTFNGLALASLGISGLAVLAFGSRRRGLIAAMSGLCSLGFLVVLAAGVLYGLVVPVAWGGAPPGVRESLGFAIGKTVSYIFVYLALYGFLAVDGWRRFGSSE